MHLYKLNFFNGPYFRSAQTASMAQFFLFVHQSDPTVTTVPSTPLAPHQLPSRTSGRPPRCWPQASTGQSSTTPPLRTSPPTMSLHAADLAPSRSFAPPTPRPWRSSVVRNRMLVTLRGGGGELGNLKP
jgi:hypothetical protein